MIGHGSEGALREAKSMIHELRALESFLYVQPDGKDQVGSGNLRHILIDLCAAKCNCVCTTNDCVKAMNLNQWT